MKRSERLVAMTNYLINHPDQLIPLTQLIKKYTASKSSISEDLDIIDEILRHETSGYLERMVGVKGGVKYIPVYSKKSALNFIGQICETLQDPSRILPGGYLYMSDLLGDPKIVKEIAKAFVTAFHYEKIDAIVTVETKGISLAYAIAEILSIPVVIIRRNMRVTEGSSVSINYVSGRSQRIQTMVLPKRHLPEGWNVCLIDDFMKAGGTISGMKSLLDEFKANVVGVGVFVEAEDDEDSGSTHDHISLVKVRNIQQKDKPIIAEPGNFTKIDSFFE